MARSIDVALTLNDRNFQAGMRRADRSVDELGTSAEGLKGKLVGLFGGIAFGATVKGLVDVYTEFERTRTVLATLLGSQQAANSELSRLQQLANALPQDLKDVTDAFVILSRNGIGTTNAELKNFSNIATGTGRSMTQLAEAVADAMTGEFERLKEFGIKVEKQNGQLVASIGGQQAFVANNARELVTQLEALGETRYGEAAANNAGTLDQSLSNLRGTIYDVTIAFMEGLAPALRLSADSMSELVTQNKLLITQMGVNTGEALRTLASGFVMLGENIDVVRNAILTLIGVRLFGNLQGILARTGQILSQYGGLARIAASVTTFGTAIGALATPLLVVGSSITALTLLFNQFEDEVVTVGDTTATYGEIVSALASQVQEGFGIMLEMASQFFEYIAGTETFQAVLQTAKNLFTDWIKIVKDFVNVSIGLFTGLVRFIVNLFLSLPDIFIGVFKTLGTAFTEFVSRGGQQFQELWDFITSMGTDSIANAFTGMGDEIAKTFAAERDRALANVDSTDWEVLLNTDYVGQALSVTGEAIGGFVEDSVQRYRALQAEVKATNDLMIDMSTLPSRRPVAPGEPTTGGATTGGGRSSRRVQSDLETFYDNLAEEAEYWSRVDEEAQRKSAELFQEFQYLKIDLFGQEESLRQTLLAQETLAGELFANNIITLEEYVALLDKMEEQFRLSSGSASFSEGWTAAFEEWKRQVEDAGEFGRQMFYTFTEGMTDAIMTFVETGKLSFRDLINDMMRQIIRMLINKMVLQFMSMFSGGGAGGGGGLGSFFGNLFGGARAGGGPVSANKAYMVGERGPELFKPSGAGTIVPNDALGGRPQVTNVSYNIQAVDARSFKELVAQDPEFIYSVSRAGARRLPA